MPEMYNQFAELAKKLEGHYKDVQDLEFTIEKGKLFMLQTRNAKRTAASAVKIAVDMVNEGVIDKRTAITRVEPAQLDQLLHPRIDPKAELKVLTTGLPASLGRSPVSLSYRRDGMRDLDTCRRHERCGGRDDLDGRRTGTIESAIHWLRASG